MSRSIRPDALADAIQQELAVYSKGVTERVNVAGRAAAEKLQQITKTTAPKASGSYRRHIAIAEEDNAVTGDKKFIWHVKKPDSRLTHLLVHGHATPTGGRTKTSPFLHNALDQVLPEYERAVEEAVKSD